jgi:ABC-2 type transport system ATP-binding protein
MYVRLGFSVAINVDPDVLLVDEVLAVGDESFQRRCNEKFADLKSEGRTIVIVSHALDSIRRLCDEAAWLEHGNLKRLGPAASVVDDYIGEVHTSRKEGDGTAGTRWGSGEGLIERVELLDGEGRATPRARTGDTVTLRLHYRMKEAIETPVFGLAIHTLEGVLVTDSSAREGGWVPAVLDGAGFVDHRIERLPILPGTYDVTVSLTAWSLVHPYDFRRHALRFDVEPGAVRDAHAGLVSLGGTWAPMPSPRSTGSVSEDRAGQPGQA